MEATFARIRQATGVNTLEEMVLKLANQSTNHTTLEEEKREAESKLSAAKAARQSEDTRFSCMKASGVGNTELNREISNKLNDEIQESRVEVRRRVCPRWSSLRARAMVALTTITERYRTQMSTYTPSAYEVIYASPAHHRNIRYDKSDPVFRA